MHVAAGGILLQPTTGFCCQASIRRQTKHLYAQSIRAQDINNSDFFSADNSTSRKTVGLCGTVARAGSLLDSFPNHVNASDCE
jgi:hypothetical protein